MIEDYYGFSSYANNHGMRSQRSAQRTERSPKLFQKQIKSPQKRSLKRTELSKQKLHSVQSKKVKIPVLPQIIKPEVSKNEPSYTAGPYQEQSSISNRQDLENIVRKYDDYMKTESIEFTNRQHSRGNGSDFTNQVRFKGRRPPPIYQNPVEGRNIPYPQQHPLQQYGREYHSASRDKTEYLTRFQRQQPVMTNAIDRAMSRSQTPRNRKALSLTNSIKKKYIMHTFYPADRKNYYNYNDDGYRNERQEELRERLEERARRAFQRAVYEDQGERVDSRPKRQTRPRRFEIEEPSRIKHQNSGILNDLRLNDTSRFNNIPVNTKRSSNRSQRSHHHEGGVVDVSIDPRKEEHYDDYQVKPQSKNQHELISNPSISQYLQADSPTKNIIANHNKEQDDSFLVFKQVEKKQQPKKILQKEEPKDIVKRSSQLSDYRSIDMMEINSNCKMTDKQLKERQKADFIPDDNKSLGINTIRSFEANRPKSKVSSVASVQSRQSQSSASDSVSQSYYSQSRTSSPQTHKMEKSGSLKERGSRLIQSSKMKVKSSQSFSELANANLDIKVHEPQPSRVSESGSKVVNMKKKDTVSEQQSLSRVVENKQGSSIVNTSKDTSQKKIKRLKRANPPPSSQQSQSNKKLESQKVESLSVLGVQSFTQNFNNLQTMQMKVNSSQSTQPQNLFKPMSKIEQTNEKINSQSDSRVKRQSQIMSRQERHTPTQSINKSNNSVVYRSKVRSSQRQGNSSALEYDLFTEIRQFIEEEEFEFHQPRKENQNQELITEQLEEVLTRIEEHLYLLNLISELIIMVPDIYDFQTIYNKEKEWIFLSTFLTLKKYLYERKRVADTLNGGRNCFTLLGNIIEDDLIKRYINEEYVRNIYTNLLICNKKLQAKMLDFYNFLVNFKKLNQNEPYYNMNPFKNSEQLGVLLVQFDKEIDTLKRKRNEEFKDGYIPQEDESEYDMLMIVNQRIFRLMEVGFALANLAGKEIKAIEKDEELFKDQQRFKDYMLQNQQLFKQMLMFYK